MMELLKRENKWVVSVEDSFESDGYEIKQGIYKRVFDEPFNRVRWFMETKTSRSPNTKPFIDPNWIEIRPEVVDILEKIFQENIN